MYPIGASPSHCPYALIWAREAVLCASRHVPPGGLFWVLFVCHDRGAHRSRLAWRLSTRMTRRSIRTREARADGLAAHAQSQSNGPRRPFSPSVPRNAFVRLRPLLTGPMVPTGSADRRELVLEWRHLIFEGGYRLFAGDEDHSDSDSEGGANDETAHERMGGTRIRSAWRRLRWRTSRGVSEAPSLACGRCRPRGGDRRAGGVGLIRHLVVECPLRRGYHDARWEIA
jgi:hypothetical protein